MDLHSGSNAFALISGPVTSPTPMRARDEDLSSEALLEYLDARNDVPMPMTAGERARVRVTSTQNNTHSTDNHHHREPLGTFSPVMLRNHYTNSNNTQQMDQNRNVVRIDLTTSPMTSPRVSPPTPINIKYRDNNNNNNNINDTPVTVSVGVRSNVQTKNNNGNTIFNSQNINPNLHNLSLVDSKTQQNNTTEGGGNVEVLDESDKFDMDVDRALMRAYSTSLDELFNDCHARSMACFAEAQKQWALRAAQRLKQQQQQADAMVQKAHAELEGVKQSEAKWLEKAQMYATRFGKTVDLMVRMRRETRQHKNLAISFHSWRCAIEEEKNEKIKMKMARTHHLKRLLTRSLSQWNYHTKQSTRESLRGKIKIQVEAETAQALRASSAEHARLLAQIAQLENALKNELVDRARMQDNLKMMLNRNVSKISTDAMALLQEEQNRQLTQVQLNVAPPAYVKIHTTPTPTSATPIINNNNNNNNNNNTYHRNNFHTQNHKNNDDDPSLFSSPLYSSLFPVEVNPRVPFNKNNKPMPPVESSEDVVRRLCANLPTHRPF